MVLTRLEFKNFRNYPKLSLDVKPGLNIFLGENGQGKSSILEAVYVGLRGRSFRPFMRGNFIRWDEVGTYIKLNFQEDDNLSEVQTQVEHIEGSLKKQASYCGKASSFKFLERKKKILVFTPEKLRVIKESSKERRELIDQLLKVLGQGSVVSDFEHGLKSKQRLFFHLKQGRISLGEARKILQALNKKFLDISCRLVEARYALLKKSFWEIQGFEEQILGQKFGVDFLYPSAQQGDKDLCREKLASLLEQGEDRELEAGRSLYGPHIEEINLLFKGKDSRYFCSQGQQRALILCLLLAQIEPLGKPLLLLDDVLSELDEKTQKNLLIFLEKKRLQTLITSVKKPWSTSKKMSFFLVKNETIVDYESSFL